LKVLFISRSKQGKPSIITYNQGESLKKEGLSVEYFLIEGGGFSGYLKYIKILKRFIHANQFDVFHAHYSLSGIIAALSGCRPLVVSLMGSDVKERKGYRLIIKCFNHFFWNACIVKTQDMKTSLKTNNVHVLPNGVDLSVFKILEKNKCKKLLNIDQQKKVILFLADPNREEKNYPLAAKSVSLINRRDITLLPVYQVSSVEIPYYLNAAELLILTSVWEGSVNVVKEAMACNLPIVSTDVGDVKKNISGINGCYIATNDPMDIKEKIEMALNYNQRTSGRKKLISLGLDSKSVAQKLIHIYKSVLRYAN